MILMAVLAAYICMIDRLAISIAIIPMANEFTWDARAQGSVMSAFFLGYVLLQVPAGWLADRWGGKWVLGVGVLFIKKAIRNTDSKHDYQTCRL